MKSFTVAAVLSLAGALGFADHADAQVYFGASPVGFSISVCSPYGYAYPGYYPGYYSPGFGYSSSLYYPSYGYGYYRPHYYGGYGYARPRYYGGYGYRGGWRGWRR